MGKYKVIHGQNIYDVALHIYGSIEGITDLMINNPSLSLADTLKAGDELLYSDDFLINPDIVAYNRINGIVPANGERNVYYKEPHYARIAEIRISNKLTSAGFFVSGSGAMEVDWGDNTSLELIELTEQGKYYHHSFDNDISTARKIRIYGDFRLRRTDITALHPSTVFVLFPVYLEELIANNCNLQFDFLPLVDGLYDLNLSGTKTRSLLPVCECRQLMTLNLSDIDVLREVLDEFLITLVKEYYGRRNCEIILTQEPSGEYREPARDEDLNYIVSTGMEAVWLLTNEPAWNEGGDWKININGTIYTYESEH